MTPVRNGTTRNSKNIYSELKDMIQFLDLKPGQAISESQLCASLGVSRTPVREALIRLADEKLVCFFPQSGTYVTRIDLDYIKELGLMRSLIERSIVLSICGKVKVIDEFQEIMFLQKLAMERKNTRESIQLNDIFHYKLFEKAGHGVIWQQITASRPHYTRYNMLVMSIEQRLEYIYNEHSAILRSIESGDSVKLMLLLESQHDCNLQDKDTVLKTYPDYFGSLDDSPESYLSLRNRERLINAGKKNA